MTDYKALYESRSAEFDELNDQFILYQGKSIAIQRRQTAWSTNYRPKTQIWKTSWLKSKMNWIRWR